MHARLKLLVAVLCSLGALATAAPAQYADREQYRRERYGTGSERYNEDRYSGQGAKNVAGEFDYYALVLSWSPTYCAQSDDETQCNRRDGRRFNFVLHGLWPQYERGWPQDCRTARRPFVPQPLIDSMMDIMPSQRLVIHEYRKHGTCSGLGPDGYFALSRKLFKSIRIPEAYKNPFEQITVEPRQLAGELMRANPGLKPEHFAIVCKNGKLTEVRICYGKDGNLRSCGANEEQRRMCSAPRVLLPPVRSTARDADTPPASRYNVPTRPDFLPGPRMERGDGRI